VFHTNCPSQFGSVILKVCYSENPLFPQSSKSRKRFRLSGATCDINNAAKNLSN